MTHSPKRCGDGLEVCEFDSAVKMSANMSIDAKLLAKEGGMCSEKLDFSYLGIYNLWNESLGMHLLLRCSYLLPDST